MKNYDDLPQTNTHKEENATNTECVCVYFVCVCSHGVSREAAESGGEGGAKRSQGNSSAGAFQLEHHHP